MNYNFCPQCGQPLKTSDENPHCPACKRTFYRNSKPCAGILPIKDGKVLLARRGVEPFKGEFDIIGGFLEAGEHPRDGAQREALEETGLTIEPIELLGMYMDTYGPSGDNTLNIFYLGEIKGGELQAKDDVASLVWLPINEVPLHEGFRNTQEAMADLKRKFASKANFA